LNHLLEELIQAQKLADFFEEEPELFIDGASRIFAQPEFQDVAKMRALLSAFDEKMSFLHALLRESEGAEVNVRIGHENEMGVFEEISLVTKDCHLGHATIGGVAVVGPTRMDYPKVVSVVDYVADTVSETMKRF
jgi:heat-inducible transcriptional repressor